MIRALLDKGVLFCAASGRQYASIWRVFEPIKDDIIYIAENGAFVCYKGEQLLYAPLSKADSEKLVRDTRAMPGCQSLYDTRYASYYEKGGEEVYHLMKDRYRYDCRIVDDLLELDEPCVKYSIYRASDIERVTRESFTPQWSQTHQVACGGAYFMDVMNRGVNKGTALCRVQQMLGVAVEETAAFGDNINDIEMLNMAYYSYAIGNAREEVKRTARFAADTNVNDGVLKVLEKILASTGG